MCGSAQTSLLLFLLKMVVELEHLVVFQIILTISHVWWQYDLNLQEQDVMSMRRTNNENFLFDTGLRQSSDRGK